MVCLPGDGQTQGSAPTFDSVIVVTDRRVLDKQMEDTIKQFAQVTATVGHAERSGDLRRFLREGKKLIISTVQKFPFILDEIGDEHRDRKFAIIIDEAHSSQGGRTSAKMNIALAPRMIERTVPQTDKGLLIAAEEPAPYGVPEEEDYEDRINRILSKSFTRGTDNTKKDGMDLVKVKKLRASLFLLLNFSLCTIL
jgi:hypothetical protein